jgi:putative oxidoreductase
MESLRDLALFVGRVFIAGIFIYDGIGILQHYAGSVAYAESFGIPGILMPLVVLLQIGGGVLILLGWWTRLVALAFAAFCVATAVFFHRDWSDFNELLHFGKDFGLAGGFLFLAAAGAGRWSADGYRASRV